MNPQVGSPWDLGVHQHLLEHYQFRRLTCHCTKTKKFGSKHFIYFNFPRTISKSIIGTKTYNTRIKWGGILVGLIGCALDPVTCFIDFTVAVDTTTTSFFQL